MHPAYYRNVSCTFLAFYTAVFFRYPLLALSSSSAFSSLTFSQSVLFQTFQAFKTSRFFCHSHQFSTVTPVVPLIETAVDLYSLTLLGGVNLDDWSRILGTYNNVFGLLLSTFCENSTSRVSLHWSLSLFWGASWLRLGTAMFLQLCFFIWQRICQQILFFFFSYSDEKQFYYFW